MAGCLALIVTALAITLIWSSAGDDGSETTGLTAGPGVPLEMPEQLPPPPSDPGPAPRLIGGADSLFVVADARAPSIPLTGEFMRYTVDQGWATLPKPLSLQQAALLTEGSVALISPVGSVTTSAHQRNVGPPFNRELITAIGSHVLLYEHQGESHGLGTFTTVWFE